MQRAIGNGNGVVMTTGVGLPPSRAAVAPAGTPDPIRTVDAAVRAVLAELNGPRSIKEVRGQSAVFADRLFSLRHAETLAVDIRTIRVTPGTVVTPLARDLLKRRGISVQLAGLAEVTPTTRGEWAFAIDSDLGFLHGLRRSLLEDERLWAEVPADVDDVTAWIVEGEGRGVVLVSEAGAVAVWRACQVRGVRAASAAETADVHRATETLGANLIVVDPAGKSSSWIKQLASAFRRAGAPRPPQGIAGFGGASR